MKFHTTILLNGKTATGIRVPPEKTFDPQRHPLKAATRG